MDWSNPAGQAVSGAFGLLGSYLNYRYQKNLAEQQNQYNIDMWKMQNEYNSPQAQMQRFEEAGLNPNLIYSQGNAGNATHAPQMVTPQAPELSEDMRRLGEAFNIEGLRTAIANRKKAQAEAKDAAANAERNELELFAEKAFGSKYALDPLTGRYVLRPVDRAGEVTVIHPAAYFMNRILENNFRTNSLLIPRSNLINSTIGLNTKRGQYLQPQITIGNYGAKHVPWTYWTGIGTNILGTAAKFIP